MNGIADELASGLSAHDLPVQLLPTLQSLAEESTKAEISSGTSVVTPENAARVHVLDSLAVFATAWLDGAPNVIDLGTGLGFPGLVVAAVRPEAEVVLLDSARKKVEAAGLIARRAGIGNAESVWGRAEELGERGSPHHGHYDVVTARALAPLAVLAEYAAPLLKLQGSLVAWKAVPDQAERDAAQLACGLLGLELEAPADVEPYRGSGPRTLWRAVKTKQTPAEYPRRSGQAKRAPLGYR